MSTDPTHNSREEVLTYLFGLKNHVKVTLNPVINNSVNPHYIEVNEAPPGVVKDVVNEFKLVSMRPGGLLIPVTQPNPQTFTA